VIITVIEVIESFFRRKQTPGTSLGRPSGRKPLRPALVSLDGRPVRDMLELGESPHTLERRGDSPFLEAFDGTGRRALDKVASLPTVDDAVESIGVEAE